MIRLGRGGKIVNIASQAGKRGFVFQGAYCASKFAVVGLTQVMAIELARYKINVNTVCPGTVDTEAIDQLFLQLSKYSKSKETPEQIRDRIIREQVPLRRIEKPEDVANLVVWLASSEADYMTGESINITGGQTMD
jgi:NAD(P)-dependent dehydrogenase (short-subunit alcohol dehydrogenase family)